MWKTDTNMSELLRHFSTLPVDAEFKWRDAGFRKTGAALATRNHDGREFDFEAGELVVVPADEDMMPEPMDHPVWDDAEIYADRDVK